MTFDYKTIFTKSKKQTRPILAKLCSQDIATSKQFTMPTTALCID